MKSLAALRLLALLAAFSACRRSDPPEGKPARQAGQSDPEVRFEVVDEQGKALPSRVHMKGPNGPTWMPSTWPAFHDHFVFPGSALFRLVPGTYEYEVERGPEYVREKGSFVVTSGTAETRKEVRVQLKRIATLANQGWYSGDLHVHRDPRFAELLMRAEDLHFAGFVTWGNPDPRSLTPNPARTVATIDGNRFADATVGEDERAGGALLFSRLSKPLDLPPLVIRDGKIVHPVGHAPEEHPATSEFARAAKKDANAHIDIEKPFWWDVPTWVGLGVADSIGIAHNHMTRGETRNHEAWGRPCDRAVYGKSPLANGYCTQDLYYRILNAGIRLAPSAGSASGILANPVGYNRVYVHVDGPFTYEAWWRGLKRGNSFVTNGPLLLVTANGERPGAVFQAEREQRVSITLDARVISNEPVRTAELIRDGEVVERGSYDAMSGAVQFPALSFSNSGWFLVRAFADRADNFRFATTAPFYVEFGGSPRISRSSVKFMTTWLEERAAKLSATEPSSADIAAATKWHDEARKFWADRLGRANAD